MALDLRFLFHLQGVQAMIPLPRNETLPQQTYTSLWACDQSLAYVVDVELAPSTNTDGYKPGCILARYTAGKYAGLFVNYDPAGTDGQNAAVVILVDQYLTAEMQKLGTQGKSLVQTVFGGAAFYQDQIYFNQQNGKDNIVPAISQIGGKLGFGRVCLYAVGI